MNHSSSYIETFEANPVLKKGGLTLKGLSRTNRQPVHLIILCDTSGSMEMENKLSSVQRSLNLLLTLLNEDDRLSLVTFADNSEIVLSQCLPSSSQRQAIQYRIDSLQANGSTNMSAGLLDTRSLLEPESSGRKQGLLLLTDGHANIGVTFMDSLIEIVKRIQTEFTGTSLTTVAYGIDHNAELMTELAKTGGGAYNVVKNLEDVATVFGDILGGLASVSVQGVQVQLPPGAEANTAFPCQTDASGITTVYVGDIYADSEITVLFKNHPSKGPLRIKGTDMRTLDRIDMVVEPTPFVPGIAPPLAIRMTEFCQRTAYIIKRVAHHKGNDMVTEIDALLTEIQNDTDISLKSMLIEDLERARDLVKSHYIDENDTIEMIQHSAFLSMTRGLRTNTRQVPIVALHRSPNAFLSPFANDVQNQIATAMRALSQHHDDENPCENNNSQ